MANLYKPRYTKRDPETGERVGKHVRKWYGRYEDADGVRQQVALCEDKQAAQAMLGEIIRRVEREKAGIIDPKNDHLQLPIEPNIDDYREHLESKQRSERHIFQTIRLVTNITEACRFQILAELQFGDDRLEKHLVDRKNDGVSHRTVNADLAAIRGFCRWLIRRERILRDPTTALEPLNVAEDRRLERRALDEEEAQKLVTSTFQSERVFRRLSGQQRATLYLLALRTGLRRNELRSLTPQSFDFSSKTPSVSLHASDSKRRKRDRLPLPVDVSKQMQEYVADLHSDDSLWPGSWWRRSADMIRRDLEEAGIPVEDEEGRVFDFHGQRTTFITGLSRAGIFPALAQKLARHSDVRLTMGTYTSMNHDELSSAVESLPELTLGNDEKSDGNIDAVAEQQLAKLHTSWPQLSDDIRLRVMSIVEEATEKGT